ncbi:L-ribulose-5-phosphate 3-epimerase [Christensenella tenuis]|jgi:L-ribulose-5-phosphate 3-epimerase|uniref:L-ribulose-5-phosphate 3-epimerase n=1 Tax=Christensenella tenuis TaxID=2763033 RepID=A0ABR7EJ70_9FIRM|nr:L-ribulose-5-phosphate 3-epimerase [Christensenella tenuis]MBC5649228.1 L-ribulose-5-phosphate 3-epimerase [Christensenella tenuis]
MKEYCLGLYEKSMPADITWEERFAAARRAGFDFIEISVDESGERLSRLAWDSERRKEFLKRMADSGGCIKSMCLSAHRKYPIGSGIPETEREGMRIMEEAILFARDLGIRIIQLAGYDVYYGETSSVGTKERFLENLYKSAMLAAKNEVILALETMENNFMNTIEKAMYYVREVGSPYLQVYPDMGNVSNGTENVTQDVRAGKGHIVAAHLKETVPGVFRDMRFGEGAVDFDTVVRCLKGQGVRSFTAEFWWDGKPDWENTLAFSHDFLARYLER